jgi:hypothetical protein
MQFNPRPLGGLVAITLAAAISASAQDYGREYNDSLNPSSPDGSPAAPDGVVPHEQMDYRAALALGITPALPDIEGTVSWDLLTTSTLGYDERFDELRPMFPPDVRALEGTQVRIVGFNIPLDSSGHRILLSLISPSCPFCLPGGPETMIEVEALEAIEAALEPIVLEGTFELIGDGVWTGLYFYRLTDARRVS